VFTGGTTQDGKFIFECVSTPVTRDVTDTIISSVHLMSTRGLKDDVVDFVTTV
jgi:hypothetical protein